MARGRPPKSKEAHKLEGTYQKCRHAERGIKFNPAKTIEMPTDIVNFKTIEVWNQIIPGLCEKGLVSIVEVPILEYAFRCHQDAMECDGVITAQGGVTSYLMDLDYKAKDLTKYRKDFMNEFNSIMFKFGVTPAENPKVRTASKKDEADLADEAVTALFGNG